MISAFPGEPPRHSCGQFAGVSGSELKISRPLLAQSCHLAGIIRPDLRPTAIIAA